MFIFNSPPDTLTTPRDALPTYIEVADNVPAATFTVPVERYAASNPTWIVLAAIDPPLVEIFNAPDAFECATLITLVLTRLPPSTSSVILYSPLALLPHVPSCIIESTQLILL